MRPVARSWTLPEIKRLLAARAEGLTGPVLADRHNRSLDSINSMLKKLRAKAEAVPVVERMHIPIRSELAKQIAMARAESAFAPPFKDGDLVWR